MPRRGRQVDDRIQTTSGEHRVEVVECARTRRPRGDVVDQGVGRIEPHVHARHDTDAIGEVGERRQVVPARHVPATDEADPQPLGRHVTVIVDATSNSSVLQAA